MRRVVFVDRDGTLVREPPGLQLDRLDQVQLMPGVIPALLRLQSLGFALVMVTNQDGLGSASFPRDQFQPVHDFVLALLSSQGIEFEAVFVCPHTAEESCECRKPAIGLLTTWLETASLDREGSFMIGDRDTDLEFAANLGVRGLRIGTASGALSWPEIAAHIARSVRRVRHRRTTRETDIEIDLSLDGVESSEVRSGVNFLDHMLEQLATHAGCTLSLSCTGDLHIDEHHTVEDTALALGAALRIGLGDKRGIGRYGFLLPMDESLAQVALDLSGRALFVWEGRFNRERVGDLPTELVPHFFRSFADALGAALHIHVRGDNTHHMVEACFKAVGRALRQALHIEGAALPSTKGVL